MARLFDGATGQLAYTLTAAQRSLSAISIHFRMLRHGGGEGGYGEVFRNKDGSNIKYVLQNNNADIGWGLGFIAHFSGGNAQWTIAYPTNDVWYDYLITYDGSSTSNVPIWYKDGIAQTLTERAAPSGALGTNDDTLVIGNTGGDDGTWDGRIAEFAIFNRVLSGAEALILGKGYSPLFVPRGLVFYDPLARYTNDIKGGVAAAVTATAVIDHPKVIYPTPAQTPRFAANPSVISPVTNPTSAGLTSLGNLNALSLNRIM